MNNGKFARGWQLTKSSWQVLRLDKELAALPVMGIVATLVTLIGVAVLSLGGLTAAGFITHGVNSTFSYTAPAWVNFIGAIILYFVVTLVANFFAAALIYGANQRFTGQDPTIKSSLGGARRKFYPLAGFSLLMTTVGLALQAAEERLPFAGDIAVGLLGAAWSIANIFAIPVIVLSETNVKPLDATKQSVQIIKKVWGEGMTANFGISIIAGLSILAYIATSLGVGIIGYNLHIPSALGAGIFVVQLIGLLLMILILTTISSIAKAALYHFAVTGIAPELFNSELLRASITPKKARRIFG